MKLCLHQSFGALFALDNILSFSGVLQTKYVFVSNNHTDFKVSFFWYCSNINSITLLSYGMLYLVAIILQIMIVA